MGLFTKGDVVVAPLDFSDFSDFKRRPALVVADPQSLHPVLCMITSRGRGDGYDVSLTKPDFASGGLRLESVVRVCQLFTLDETIIEYQVGKLHKEKLEEVTNKIVEMFNAKTP
jgi:mRNA interferase MazF